MPIITYAPWTPPTRDGAAVVNHAREICREYIRQGYVLTLRGLYYQLVARDLFPDSRRFARLGTDTWRRDPSGTKNATPNYKWLGGLVSDARLGGLLDWSYLDDTMRGLVSGAHWDSPVQILRDTPDAFAMDMWTDQPTKVEVWVEKDALSGPISRAANEWDVPWFGCRGYVSQSAMWKAGQRIHRYLSEGKRVVILHLGDHDPSGIDMTRDIRDRLERFIVQDWINRRMSNGRAYAREVWDHIAHHTDQPNPFEVRRIALNMDQIEELNPPPNPAKIGDSRSADYIREYGYESWELDALEPAYLVDLITEHIEGELDRERYNARRELEETGRRSLSYVIDRWDEIVDYLEAN